MKRYLLRYLLLLLLPAWLLVGVMPVCAQEADTSGVDAAPMQEFVPAQAAGGGSVGPSRVRRRIAQIRGGAGPVVVYPVVVAPAAATAAALPEAETIAEASTGLTRRDLDRLEALLLRRLDQRFENLEELLLALGRRGSQVIVLEDVEDRVQLQAVLDSVLQQPTDAQLPEIVPPRPAVPILEQPRAQPPLPPLTGRATVEQIERSILETGLFQSVNVNFEFDRSELLPTAAPTLDAVGEVLARYPELRIEVSGHTDAIGSEAYNERLSQARAESARAYLLENFSLDPSRLEAEGYGEARPIASNATPTGRTLNRRVGFRVLNPEAAERYLRTLPQAEERPQEEEEASGAAQPEMTPAEFQESLRELIREELRQATGEDQ